MPCHPHKLSGTLSEAAGPRLRHLLCPWCLAQHRVRCPCLVSTGRIVRRREAEQEHLPQALVHGVPDRGQHGSNWTEVSVKRQAGRVKESSGTETFWAKGKRVWATVSKEGYVGILCLVRVSLTE